MGKMALDFGERAARCDLEHKRGVAKQSAVADRRNECIVRAFDDLEADRTAAESGAEEVLQVAHHRPEHVFKVILVIERVFAGPPLTRREGGKLANEMQELVEQPLGMQIAGRAVMLERR